MSYLSDLSLRLEAGRKILGTGALMVACFISPMVGFSPVSSIFARNMLYIGSFVPCITEDFVSDSAASVGDLALTPCLASKTSDLMR